MHEKHKQELQESIRKLRDERDSLDSTQKEKRKRIDQFIDDLEHHIVHPEDGEHATRIRANLPELIKLFEVRHPGITDILNKVTMILSNMGI